MSMTKAKDGASIFSKDWGSWSHFVPTGYEI